MEKINASVEARCSACRDRKEKRATCGWHGMAWQPGSTEGGVAACHRRGRLQAPARISRRRSGGGVRGGEGGPETSLSPEADGDGEAEQTARYECTHDDGHEARWIWPRGHPRILTGQCARAPASASASGECDLIGCRVCWPASGLGHVQAQSDSQPTPGGDR